MFTVKIIWIITFLVMSNIVISAPLNAQDTGAAGTAMLYFKACQSGDIDAIKDLIAGPLYAKKSSLLNNNADYSNFLIDQFNGVTARIISETQNDANNGTVVILERQYPNGSSLQTKLVVKYQDTAWKIYDEQLIVD